MNFYDVYWFVTRSLMFLLFAIAVILALPALIPMFLLTRFDDFVDPYLRRYDD